MHFSYNRLSTGRIRYDQFKTQQNYIMYLVGLIANECADIGGLAVLLARSHNEFQIS